MKKKNINCNSLQAELRNIQVKEKKCKLQFLTRKTEKIYSNEKQYQFQFITSKAKSYSGVNYLDSVDLVK